MDIDYEIFIRFILAALWGGIVGAEREYRNKSAGFRTMIMISLGSCFFTIMSELIGGANTPDRIAANIVTGIGFLGAGVIFRSESRVNGITTAATIWSVAAVGMGIGAGSYFASAAASIMIIIVLAVLPYGERFFGVFNQLRVYTLQCDFSPEKAACYENLLNQYELQFKLIKAVKDSSGFTITWQALGKAQKHEQFIAAIYSDHSVKRMEYC